jgi:hypothetical protein
VNIFCLLGKEGEIVVFSWQETLQESRHGGLLPPDESCEAPRR